MSNALRIGNRSISYEQAKEMLFPELIPQKGNEAMLSTVPHEKVEDMAVVFRLDLHSESGMMMSIRVNQAILDGFGVTADQIKQDALENAPHTHPASLRSMQEVLGDMMGGLPVPGPEPGQPTLYVATMETMNHGAGVLAYPGFLDEAAEKLGGNFFILPSSIHELLFLQDNGTMDRHELTAMVRSINAAEVSPEDQLSDNVYHYDGKDRVFELAEKYDARKAERQTERPSVLQALKEKSEAARPQPILIAMQKPGATLVAGYTAWQKEHDRHVKKGEKGIQIIAPSPYKVKQERDALDPKTGKPQMDAQGNPLKEIIEVERPAFKVATVFDISQTEGKELPSIGVNELSGGVEGYEALFDALKATCPVPIAFEDIPSGAKGYYHTEDHRIALQEGMSQMQTVKTLIHEMSHERMHSHEKEKPVEERLSRRSMEVEAESVAFVVGTALSAEHPELKLDFSDYSFGYIAGWSSGKETAELKASLGRIQATASEMISEIEGHLQELQKSEQLQAVDEIDQKAAAMDPVKTSVVAEPSVMDKPSVLANLHKEMPKMQKPAVSKGKEECL